MIKINQKNGFTLIELMIVVAIIGVLAAIAYPSYQRYVIKSKRADMMSEMHNIALEIQARKLAQGTYSDALKLGLEGDYPSQGTALYTVTVNTIVAPVTPPAPQPSAGPLTAKWIITATPKSGQMASDGTLTLNYSGIKCRATACGNDDSWNQ